MFCFVFSVPGIELRLNVLAYTLYDDAVWQG